MPFEMKTLRLFDKSLFLNCSTIYLCSLSDYLLFLHEGEPEIVEKFQSITSCEVSNIRYKRSYQENISTQHFALGKR